VRLLLDTHVLLWSAETPEKLSATARRELEDASNTLFFSAASIWEIAIKISVGKLHLSMSPGQLVESLANSDFTELPVASSHAAKVASIPLHHRDPFDRLLIAQAEIEQLSLVSKDTGLDVYGIRRLW
jgi:PIN domain nuclease of toxin-antitoxin system